MSDRVFPDLNLVNINLDLMIADTEAELGRQITDGNDPGFHGGFLLGAVAAKYLLEGHTADETWDHVKRLRFRVSRGTEEEGT